MKSKLLILATLAICNSVQAADKIEELSRIESAEFRELNRLLGLLKGAKDGTGSLLDHTTLLIGSNLGNASSHSWRDLPILVASGSGLENTRFSNLFVEIGQHLGAKLDAFGTSNGTSVKGWNV